jgi:hypothetical protein
MNPDIFITIVFAGLAVLVTLLALALVVLRIRRDDARAVHEGSRLTDDGCVLVEQTENGKAHEGAAVQ